MKRLVITTIINLSTESILIATIVGVVIVIIGYINHWNSSIAYSNAFFLAGCLVIVAGTASRLGAGAERNNHQLLYAESFGEMSNGERANLIVNASSSMRLAILGILSGILLMIISAIVVYLL